MPESFRQFLTEQPIALFFIVVGLGYLIGKIRIAGFELGAVSGVLFVGLFFGHHGYGMSERLQSMGFMLFIYSVGFQAGPRFFAVLKTDGLKYLSLAVVIGATGFVVALVMAKMLGLEPGAAAGLLSGGLTSSPTLAAAQEAVHQGQAPVPDGYTAEGVMTNVTTAYAITYIFGLVGLILIVRFLPKALGVDLKAEAAKLAAAGDLGGVDDEVRAFPDVVARAYRIQTSEFAGITLRDLHVRWPGRATVEKIRRGGEFIEVTDDTTLEVGDEVGVVARLGFFTEDVDRPKLELSDPALIESAVESCRIVVTRRNVKGRAVDPADVTRRAGCFLARLRRLRVDVPLGGDVELTPGDVLHVTGPRSRLDKLGAALGHVERDVQETDLVTLALGIAAGIFIGTLSVTIAGVPIGLGAAGGLLMAGLVIGYLRAIHPVFGRMPSAARWLFMELGLLMFMAGVGLRAGSKIIETLQNSGANLFVAGLLVTSLPVLVGYFFGRRALKINPVLLLGGVTGSMTSGASLSIVIREAGNSMPALGYTGAYAFANIILTIAGSIILLF